MSKKIGNVFVICPEPDGKCELCGAFEETRPYGPGGKRVCFDCGMKDPELCARQMERAMDGLPPEPEQTHERGNTPINSDR